MAAARSTPPLDRSLREWLFLLPAVGMASVPAIVVPAILWARFTFHRLHPDADPGTYLTISRAISDPAVGEPFALWVTAAAVILWVSLHAILWMFIAEHPRRPAISPGRDRTSRLLWVAMWSTMTATCVGMVMLSQYRLGSGATYRLHMIGSYVFFAGQAMTILLAAVYHSLVGPARAATVDYFFADRWRARAGYAVFFSAVLYGVLFKVKSMDFGAATPWVISAYVELETILIIVFLGYLVAYLVDARRFLRARASGRSVAAAASQPTASPVEALPDPIS